MHESGKQQSPSHRLPWSAPLALGVRAAAAAHGVAGWTTGRLRRSGETGTVAALETSIVAASRAAVIGLDGQGRVRLWNAAAERIFGFAGDEAIGQALAELIFTPADRDARREALTPNGDGERVSELVAVRADGTEFPIWLRAAPLPDAGDTKVAVYAHDLTDLRRAELNNELLARTAKLLGSAMDYERTLCDVAALAVPDFADWCGVDVPTGPRGLPSPVTIAHAKGELVEAARELRRRYPVTEDDAMTHVMRSGDSFLQSDVPEEALVAYAKDAEHLRLLRAVGFRSLMVVPLKAGRRTIGAMTFVASREGRRFDERDLALAQEIAERAGTAVENARLSEERAEVTRTLLATLRPPQLPAVPGWETATLYQPAERASEVGGDFYDIFAVRDGWMLVIGDVIGKGPAAAALTSLARWSIRSAATHTASPSRALSHLNADLDREGQPGLLSAACVLLREDEDGTGATATIAVAGHPLPIVVRDGDARPVGRHSLLLGVSADATFAETTVAMRDDDAIVLYTDGILDLAGADDRFGERRLLESLRSQSNPAASELTEGVRTRLAEFRAGLPADDIALLAARRSGRRRA